MLLVVLLLLLLLFTSVTFFFILTFLFMRIFDSYKNSIQLELVLFKINVYRYRYFFSSLYINDATLRHHGVSQ